MPIRAELRHLYRGPAYRAQRTRIMARAGHKCESCRAPNLKPVLRACGWWAEANFEATLLMMGGRINGHRVNELMWHCAGLPEGKMLGFPKLICHWAGISLAMVHLDQNPLNNGDDNLSMLCQWCHLHRDEDQHRQTRQRRKDATRPLLAADPGALVCAYSPLTPVLVIDRRKWASAPSVVDPWVESSQACGVEAVQ